MRHPRLSLVTGMWAGLLLASVSHSPAHAQRVDPEVQTLRAILQKPEAEIDLARVKLTIDRMVDPSVDVEATLQKLDAMAASVKASAGANAPSFKTASMLRSYLYDAGSWNNRQPFQYDLDDPLGRKVSSKLLPTYLTTKRGNCVSMPTLFVLLAQKLGLDATFAEAPGHFFVKYRDEAGRSYNLETTSGGNQKTDESYQRDTPMTPKALKSGIYMRPLSKKESVVTVLMDPLVEHYKLQGNPERIIALSDLALEHYPKNVDAMLNKGYAYYLILKRDFLEKYPAPKDIPAADRSRFEELSRNNHAWFQKAEELGWREPNAEADTRYLQTVRKVKRN
ncbi:transglutaminase family protein [Polaromonas sp. YR568]|uniref:transglutaminase family protein n=1 Tax=Polaromonas sp. YR568 TaxID=1855301 RepID=UPI00398BF271